MSIHNSLNFEIVNSISFNPLPQRTENMEISKIQPQMENVYRVKEFSSNQMKEIKVDPKIEINQNSFVGISKNKLNEDVRVFSTKLCLEDTKKLSKYDFNNNFENVCFTNNSLEGSEKQNSSDNKIIFIEPSLEDNVENLRESTLEIPLGSQMQNLSNIQIHFKKALQATRKRKVKTYFPEILSLIDSKDERSDSKLNLMMQIENEEKQIWNEKRDQSKKT